MKFCKHCGTQISDESTVCQKCHSSIDNISTNDETQRVLLKKFNQLLIIIPLFVIITAVATFVLTYFVLPKGIADAIGGADSASVNGEGLSSSKEINTVASYNSVSKCPEDEYGYHDWEPANCVTPARCSDCGEYKDNILAENIHDWIPATCVQPAKCSWCGEYKDDKLAEDNHRWDAGSCVEAAGCYDCGAHRYDDLGRNHHYEEGKCRDCGKEMGA